MPGGAIIMLIAIIIREIIMAAARDTTKEPDTVRAGMLAIFLSNFIVFISKSVKRKTSLWPITAERFESSFCFSQQRPTVPQPIIMIATVIMLLMLLKICFIFFLFCLAIPPNISCLSGMSRGIL